jgi:hypothetical protein
MIVDIDTCSMVIILKILLVWYLLLGGAFFIALLPSLNSKKRIFIAIKIFFFWLPYLIKWGRER